MYLNMIMHVKRFHKYKLLKAEKNSIKKKKRKNHDKISIFSFVHHILVLF